MNKEGLNRLVAGQAVFAAEMADYHRKLMIDAVTVRDSGELLARTKQHGDETLARVRARLDELLR